MTAYISMRHDEKAIRQHFVCELPELTLGVATARHQIVQPAVVATDLVLAARLGRRDQVPDEVLDLLVAFVHLQAIEELLGAIKRTR